MTSILVSLAVEAELARWRELHRLRQSSNSAVYETTVGCTPVVAVLAGVGVRRVDLTAAPAAEHRPGASILAGAARAAKPELAPGDVLVAKPACDASENETAWSDPWLVDCAERCGAKRVRRFVTVSRTARIRKPGPAWLVQGKLPRWKV